jgi:hypothetical protein
VALSNSVRHSHAAIAVPGCLSVLAGKLCTNEAIGAVKCSAVNRVRMSVPTWPSSEQGRIGGGGCWKDGGTPTCNAVHHAMHQGRGTCHARLYVAATTCEAEPRLPSSGPTVARMCNLVVGSATRLPEYIHAALVEPPVRPPASVSCVQPATVGSCPHVTLFRLPAAVDRTPTASATVPLVGVVTPSTCHRKGITLRGYFQGQLAARPPGFSICQDLFLTLLLHYLSAARYCLVPHPITG